MSPKELEILFDLTYTAIQYRLRTLGLNLSHEEGISGKKNRHSQNYPKTTKEKNKTRTKSLYSTLSPNSSKNQEYIRSRISNVIGDYLDPSIYEVVVGYSNTDILGSLEIDIPIMIYSPKTKKVFRFAIEYNSIYWHTKKRDQEKEAKVIQKGWYYIPIIEISNGRYSNDPKLLDNEVKKLCTTIKDMMQTDQ